MRSEAGEDGVEAGEPALARVAGDRAGGMAAVTLRILDRRRRSAVVLHAHFVVNADDLVVAATEADAVDVAITEIVAVAERIADRVAARIGRLERRAQAVVTRVDVADDDAIALESAEIGIELAVQALDRRERVARKRVAGGTAEPHRVGADEARAHVVRERASAIRRDRRDAGQARDFIRFERRQCHDRAVERVAECADRLHLAADRRLDFTLMLRLFLAQLSDVGFRLVALRIELRAAVRFHPHRDLPDAAEALGVAGPERMVVRGERRLGEAHDIALRSGLSRLSGLWLEGGRSPGIVDDDGAGGETDSDAGRERARQRKTGLHRIFSLSLVTPALRRDGDKTDGRGETRLAHDRPRRVDGHYAHVPRANRGLYNFLYEYGNPVTKSTARQL